MRTPAAVLLLAAAATASLTACDGRREAPRASPAASRAKVLATVNGVPITEADVNHRTKKAVTGGGPDHAVSENVLQTLVRDELVYQAGLELGLDAEPEYRLRVEDLEAQLRTFQRQEMGSLYRRHVQAEAAVTDADAQAFFEQNVAFIQTRFHVLQIFHKGGGIERDQQALQSGVPFEEVAARRFPRLPPGDRAPWDLGELTWSQIPKAWRGVVDRLEPGQVSDVIKGDNERWWVLKLAGKAVDPGITLATERARIGEALRQQKADEVYARLLAERREKASIVYAK